MGGCVSDSKSLRSSAERCDGNLLFIMHINDPDENRSPEQ